MLDALPVGLRFGLSRSVPAGKQTTYSLNLDAPPVPALDELLAKVSPYRLLYTIPPPGDGDDDARLQRFLELLDIPPERFVYLSTSGVYGDRAGQLTDETVPAQPQTDRARRRVDAERRLRRWCESRGVDCLIFRVPGIYGPGRLGVERIKTGTQVLRAADAGPGNRIHVDDLKRCCLAALQSSAPAGIYNLGDGDNRSSAEFTAAVARLAGLPAPEAISMDDARRHWSPARLSFLEESRLLDLTRMHSLLGVTASYADAEEGIRASLATRPEAGPTAD